MRNTADLVRAFSLATVLASCTGNPTYRGITDDACDQYPAEFAGRRERVQGNGHIVYAHDASVAERLARWVDEELPVFRKRYGPTAEPGVGLVVAIEADEEPVERLETWVRANTGHPQDVDQPPLTELPKRNPYVLRRPPYFRESFSIPYRTAIELNLLNLNSPRPSWICFLTSDDYLDATQDRMHREARRRQAAEGYPRGGDPWLIFLAVEFYSFPRRKALDQERMHLQRRETLWTGLFSNTGKRTEIHDLRNGIEAASDEVYRTRPID